MEKLSSNLKQLLHDANLTEAELARRTGIPQPMVNRLAKGKNKNPKLETLKPIIDYFSITFSQLLGEQPLELNELETRKDIDNKWKEVVIIPWEYLTSNNKEICKNYSGTKELIPTSTLVSAEAFAVKLHDNSFAPRFPQNTVLVLEPKITPKAEDFILICEKQTGILKLISHGNSYDTSNDDILGVLVEARYNYM